MEPAMTGMWSGAPLPPGQFPARLSAPPAIQAMARNRGSSLSQFPCHTPVGKQTLTFTLPGPRLLVSCALGTRQKEGAN